MLLGQEVELALRALHETLAGQAAGAERDFRLGDVIAGAERVLGGIEEDLDPAALVVMQPSPDHRRKKRCRQADAEEIKQVHAGQEHQRQPDETEHRCRAEVGLPHRQGDRHCDHRQRNKYTERPGHAFGREVVVVPGESEDECDLHQLGRLEGNVPDAEPAARAQRLGADERHQDQHAKRNPIRRIGEVEPPVQRCQGDRQHHREGEDETQRMLVGPGAEAAARDRIERRNADGCQDAQYEDQRPMNVQQLGPDGAGNRERRRMIRQHQARPFILERRGCAVETSG